MTSGLIVTGCLLWSLVLPSLLHAQGGVHTYYILNDERSEGQTSNGQKVGIWHYYNEAGELALTLDYDQRQVVFRKQDNTVGYLAAGSRWRPVVLRHLPSFPGSPVDLDAFVCRHLAYPDAAVTAGASGEVVVSAVIDAQGIMRSVSIEKDFGYDSGRAVMDAVKMLKSSWLPAHDGNRYVTAKVFFSVMFTLDPLPDFVSPGHLQPQTTGMGRVNQHPRLNFFRTYIINKGQSESPEFSRT